MNVARFIDYFIHKERFDDPNHLRKTRLLIRANLLTSLFSNSYIWLSWLFSFDKGVYLMIFNVLGFLLLPFLCKTKLPITWLGNLYVFVGAFAIAILTYYSGGIWSAIYPWIIAIPVLALLVVNKLSGTIWGVISFLAMIWFGVLAYLRVNLPTEYNTDLHTLWYISILPGLLLIILFIAFVFEATQSKAFRYLAEKNTILEAQKETISTQSSELKKLLDEKNYIIRILAHDLRNPLANITSLIRLMKNETELHLKDKYESLIDKASANVQDLISRVLEMDVSDQDEIEIHWEQLDVGKVTKEVCDSMRVSAGKKDIQLDMDINQTEVMINADKTYLSLIIENLLSNAIKFSEKGKSVLVSLDFKDPHVQILVADEGPGIRKEEEGKLFKKFSRLSAKPTGGESSIGLGLSLVKRYVELIGGKVWYEGKSGKGATFVVQLPISD